MPLFKTVRYEIFSLDWTKNLELVQIAKTSAVVSIVFNSDEIDNLVTPKGRSDRYSLLFNNYFYYVNIYVIFKKLLL